ncbi:tyrosine-type recombinase/integrase [Microcoleus sp. CAWBG58]|uniref:tyrosine-type recombinase/integrase n=1 Tax=Microcoleus sp. CAWBG58 TaxID=2841651 RepID=UPI0025F7064C|nr:tyrosine-type recombinase/integrase [Microcoleus sp. CAWBG58]
MTQDIYERISKHFFTDVHRVFLAVSWYTGERPEAILKSKVSQFYVNPSRRIVRSEIIYSATTRKDKKTREVPCHIALEKILRDYECLEDGYLFPSRVKPGKPLSRQAIDRAFRRALKKAGLENQGYSLYSARRGFITEKRDGSLWLLDMRRKSVAVSTAFNIFFILVVLQSYFKGASRF